MKKLLVIIFAIALLLASCAQIAKPEAQTTVTEPDPVSVQTEIIVPSQISASKSFSSNVLPAAEIPVVVVSPGEVKSILVSVGDEVKSGQILATLKQDSIDMQIRQAQAAYDSAVASRNSAGNARSKLQKAINDIKKKITDATNDIIDIPNKIDKIIMNPPYPPPPTFDPVVTKLTALSYIDPLMADINKSLIDQQYLAGQISQLEYFIYDTVIQTVKRPGFLASSLASMQAQYNSLPPLSVYNAQVESATVALELSNMSKDNLSLKAPISGNIATLNLSVGGMATSAIPAFTIIDKKIMYLDVMITEDDISTFEGISNVQLDISSKKVKATLVYVTPTSNVRTAAYTARLAIIDETVTPGSLAKFTLISKQIDAAIVVPNSAIIADLAQRYVFVITDGRAIRKAVEVGFSDGTDSEILSGLSIGEKIVIKGASFLSDGVRVTEQ